MSSLLENSWSPALCAAYLDVLEIRKFGDHKHGEWTWGPRGSADHIAGAIRHFDAVANGRRVDAGSGRLHLAHAAARALMALACDIKAHGG
jgi:hypothetical protein